MIRLLHVLKHRSTLLLNKAKVSAKLLKNAKSITDQKSYYPDMPHKSRKEILKDQLYFVRKYGNYEKFYFPYGFDRKEMVRKRMCSEYVINEDDFLKKVDYHNNHINRKQGRFSGRCIISDKFYFYLFLKSLGYPTPSILYYTINQGLFYNIDNQYVIKQWGGVRDILVHDMDAFAKPYGGQLGDGAFAIKVDNSKVYVNGDLVDNTDDLIKTFTNTNYIVQNRIVQHPQMDRLCSTSLNTIRLHTLITENEEIIAFGAALRMGREGSAVDNWAKGGIIVGVDMNTGKLLKTGFIKPPYGTTVTEHPDNGLVFETFQIPFFKEAVEMAKELHSKLYRIHSIGWDIAISENGPVFIEGNSLWEISLLQTAVGGLKEIEKYFN